MNQPILNLLFPTPVVKVKLDRHEEHKKNLIPKLMKWFRDNPENHMPWDSEDHSYGMYETSVDFKLIDQQIETTYRDFVNYLIGREIGIPLTHEGWWNIHDSNHYMESHNHLSALAAGIYYLKLDTDKDFPATFTNPQRDVIECWDGFGEDSLRINNQAFKPSTFPNDLNIEEGDLILFPPYFNHFVKRSHIQHDEYRISYAFNVSRK